MKKPLTLSAGITGLFMLGLAVVLSGTWKVQRMNTSLLDVPGIQAIAHEEEGGANEYAAWLHEMRADPITGEIPLADVLRGREDAYRLLANSGRRGNLNLQWEFMGPNNVGGRTRAILIDRDNPVTMFAGGVSGGLWISHNNGNSWEPYTGDDTLAGLGVVSMTQAANGDIYVGTGERLINAGTTEASWGFLGEGIWKSTDHGNTFVHLAATKPSGNHNSSSIDWTTVNVLAAHPTNPDVILAGTYRGVYRTTDGGATWSKMGSGAMLVGNIQDIKIASDGTTYVCAGSSYYRGNVDDPSSFESRMSKGGFPSSGLRRIMFAPAPSDPAYVYCIACDNAGQTVALLQSTDGGLNWTSIAPTSLPSNFFNPSGNQGWYDLEIAVNPDDKERVYVGGQLSIYEWTATDGWYPISNWFSSPASDPQYIHADHHEIVFHPNNGNIMYLGTDGGIFRTQNAKANYPNLPVFQQLNKGYGVTQFYSISAGLDGTVMGGSQDNGTIYVDFSGNTLQQGRHVGGGDGGFTDISKTNPDALFFASQEGSLRRSSNSGHSSNAYYDSHIDDPQDNDFAPDCGAPFITPFRLWEQTDTSSSEYGTGIMYLATYCGLWAAVDALNFGDNPTWFQIAKNANGLTGIISYIEVTPDGDIVYAGTKNGYLYRIDGLSGVTWEYNDNGTPADPSDDFFDPDSAGIHVTRIASFGRYITCIAADKSDPNHVVVSLGNYGTSNFIYRSTTAATDSTANGTGSFTSIQGSGSNALPRMPVYSCLIDKYSGAILAGTELGIYSTTNNGTSWAPESAGMPFAATFQLREEMIEKLDGSCYVIYAGTHGRGFYRTTTLTPASCNTAVGIADNPVIRLQNLAIYPNPVQDMAYIDITLDKPGSAQLLVFDLQGKKVLHKDLGYLDSGTNNTLFSVSNLANGTYILLVRMEDYQKSLKFVVQR